MKFKESYEKAYQQSLKMIESGLPPKEVLAHLVNAAEKAAGSDTVSSILLLDKDGLLRNGASPKLPPDYLSAIDGLKPHAELGTCAAAAATGSVIITEDFCADDKWAELRHLPLALGFKGAWSSPIKDANNKVIGTFGTYFREQRLPSQEELQGVKLLASAAAIAVTKAAKTEAPQR
ncbi:MAG TPA: GAF domain-containing protein [Sphingobacteriaceae bacterium]